VDVKIKRAKKRFNRLHHKRGGGGKGGAQNFGDVKDYNGNGNCKSLKKKPREEGGLKHRID